MHNLNLNLDIFHILTYLNEYGVYIFLCGIFGFGSLIYFISIKSPNPQFTTPKLSKKKIKKEKNVRIKDVKLDSLKSEIREPIDNLKNQDIEIPDAGKDVTEDDLNSDWQSVVKSKRVTKRSKTSPELSNESIKTKIEKSIIKPSAVGDDLETVIKYEPKKSVIKKPESLSKNKPIEIVPIDVTKKSNLDIDRKSKFSITEEKKESKNLGLLVEPKTVNISESPTNSLSDDFELIDIIKTSSEEGSKVEIVEHTSEIGQSSAISSTSGASRKKIKKQQKLVSKQLIEAAEIELGSSSVQERDNYLEEKSQQIKIDVPSIVTIKKKKRPRKDI